MPRTPLVVALVLAGLATSATLVSNGASVQAATSRKALMSYADASPVLEAMRDSLPADLTSKSRAELESAWPAWASRRDADIRRRLERGDEDSVVNFWMYGTTFTKLPRATERDISDAGRGVRTAQVIEGRLEDLMTKLTAPNLDERIQLARQVIERRGIDLTTDAGRRDARRYLIDARQRVIEDYRTYDRTLLDAHRSDPSAGITAFSTIFHDRGLSSDTSLLSSFVVEQALAAIAAQGTLRRGSVRRVGIVGPGLDFTNKADGYDFYPQQTIQPLALIDSLVRLGLATADDLRVTTFDLSPRVNQHLEAARQRARDGTGYVLQLPLSGSQQWSSAVVAFWRRFGDQIGENTRPASAPPGAGDVRVRAVRVHPPFVTSIVPTDVDIVVERLAKLSEDERFDLIVATNVLVYYGLFEQTLALANVASMLRPGGVFLANSAVFPVAPMQPTAGYLQVVYSDRLHDNLFWYRRE